MTEAPDPRDASGGTSPGEIPPAREQDPGVEEREALKERVRALVDRLRPVLEELADDPAS